MPLDGPNPDAYPAQRAGETRPAQGASHGARIVGTAMREMQRRGGKKALATMCIGVGQGIALAIEAA